MDSALTKDETYLLKEKGQVSVNQLSVIFSYALDTVGLKKKNITASFSWGSHEKIKRHWLAQQNKASVSALK